MIDPTSEDLLTLQEARDWVKRLRGRRNLSLETVHRWCIRGLRGVLLESIKVGGARMTSRQALVRFFGRPVELAKATVEPATDPSGPNIETIVMGMNLAKKGW